MVYFFIFLFFLLKVVGFSILGTIGVLVFLNYVVEFILKINEEIAIRHLLLILYSLNFLFSPALMYVGLEKYQYYAMKMDETEYFLLALPSVFLLHKGVYLYKTPIFSPNIRILRMTASVYESHLVIWVLGGILVNFFSYFFPSELAFFLYLISSIRYVGVFSLMVLDVKKYWKYIVGTIFYDFLQSLKQGMFHDVLLWTFLGLLLYGYIVKPTLKQKIVVIAVVMIATFVLQLTKGEYRSRLSDDEDIGINKVSLLVDAVSASTLKSNKNFFSFENIASSLTRVNQAWIFASTVENVKQTNQYQGGSLLYLYFEAALLPRFIAPDKLSAGDKSLFIRFSGKTILDSTSMGLGILSDGFISFGTLGVYIFIFVFGLIFSLIFKVVEYWSEFSLLFIFFLFPLIIYPIRPDCATSTIMGHIVKGLIVFQGLFIYYNWYNKEKSDYVKEIAHKRGLLPFG